jgi:archaeosine-15-forming tRNA-guanine transglycosylase
MRMCHAGYRLLTDSNVVGRSIPLKVARAATSNISANTDHIVVDIAISTDHDDSNVVGRSIPLKVASAATSNISGNTDHVVVDTDRQAGGTTRIGTNLSESYTGLKLLLFVPCKKITLNLLANQRTRKSKINKQPKCRFGN